VTNHEDYAHIRDAQSDRTKWELWAIVVIVVVVVFGSILWRAVTHHPAKPQTDWRRNTASSTLNRSPATSPLPAAAADSMPR
jgi:hypothetical protein